MLAALTAALADEAGAAQAESDAIQAHADAEAAVTAMINKSGMVRICSGGEPGRCGTDRAW